MHSILAFLPWLLYVTAIPAPQASAPFQASTASLTASLSTIVNGTAASSSSPSASNQTTVPPISSTFTDVSTTVADSTSLSQLPPSVPTGLLVSPTSNIETVMATSATPSLSPSFSSTTASPIRTPLPTANLDDKSLRNCRLPTLEEVEINEALLHDVIDPNDGDTDSLDARVWQALNMDQWLAKTMEYCPALASNEGWTNKKEYRFPLVLGKVMYRQGLEFDCSMRSDCQWTSDTDTFPDSHSPPYLTEFTDELITRHRRLRDAGHTPNSFLLYRIVSDIVYAVGIDGFQKVLHEFQDELQIKATREALLNGIKEWRPHAMENIKGAAKAAAALNGALKPKIDDTDFYFLSTTDFATKFAVNMGKLEDGVSSAWQVAMYGPPTAPGGYLQMVKGGAFAGPERGTPEEEIKTRDAYGNYIIDKMIQMIWRDKKIFLYRDTRESEGECKNQRGTGIRGIACYPDPSGGRKWYRYIPFAAESNWYMNTYTGNWASETQTRDWYMAFDESVIDDRGSWNLTSRDIYEGSTACHEANNKAWYDQGKGRLPALDRTQIGQTTSNLQGHVNLYSPETIDIEKETDGQDMLRRQCHWNIPVLDASSLAATTGCSEMRKLCGRYSSWYFGASCSPIDNIYREGGSAGARTREWGRYEYLAYASNLFASPVEKMTCYGLRNGN